MLKVMINGNREALHLPTISIGYHCSIGIHRKHRLIGESFRNDLLI